MSAGEAETSFLDVQRWTGIHFAAKECLRSSLPHTQSYDANGQGTQFGRLREQFATLGRLINAQPALRQGSR